MDVNNLNVVGPLKAGVDQMIYSTVLGSTQSTITISGLHGDTDLIYYMRLRIVAASNSGIDFGLQFNGDTGNNYNYQLLAGAGSTVSAGSGTAQSVAYVDSNGSTGTGHIMHCEFVIFAKSGNIRPILGFNMDDITSTPSVSKSQVWANTWTNTVNEITSITLTTSALTASQLLSGTYLQLWARRGTRN